MRPTTTLPVVLDPGVRRARPLRHWITLAVLVAASVGALLETIR